MKFKYIKKFSFNVAKYNLADEKGNNFTLVVNYKDNNFEIENGTNLENAVTEEVKATATDLLSRKHGKNFAGTD